MRIGFIGLGSMGTAIARNLVKAGHDVRAWNRTAVAPDTVPGMTLLDDAADAFQTEVVFTMLSDDAVIREVIIEPALLKHARPAEARSSGPHPHRDVNDLGRLRQRTRSAA